MSSSPVLRRLHLTLELSFMSGCRTTRPCQQVASQLLFGQEGGAESSVVLFCPVSILHGRACCRIAKRVAMQWDQVLSSLILRSAFKNSRQHVSLCLPVVAVAPSFLRLTFDRCISPVWMQAACGCHLNVRHRAHSPQAPPLRFVRQRVAQLAPDAAQGRRRVRPHSHALAPPFARTPRPSQVENKGSGHSLCNSPVQLSFHRLPLQRAVTLLVGSTLLTRPSTRAALGVAVLRVTRN